MGWASGGEIFDPVARKLIDLDVPDRVRREICTVLIAGLQSRGWDTEGESLGEFQDDPSIVTAFRENGIIRTCADEDGPGLAGWCELELNHAGDHDDELGNTWPRTGGADA